MERVDEARHQPAGRPRQAKGIAAEDAQRHADFFFQLALDVGLEDAVGCVVWQLVEHAGRRSTVLSAAEGEVGGVYAHQQMGDSADLGHHQVVDAAGGTPSGSPTAWLRRENLGGVGRNPASEHRNAYKKGVADTSSGLIIPVSEADPLIKRWRRYSSLRCPRRVGAHISLIVPFLSPRLIDLEVWEQLACVAAEHQSFEFELARVRRFPPEHPGGRQVLYLAPAPEQPFVSLMQDLWRRWPQAPPYGGEFAGFTPHLTVTCASPALLAQAEAQLRTQLPLRARAHELWLTQVASSGQVRIERFPLGQALGAYGVHSA